MLQVTLVGHSAGGWLARAFVADPLYFDSPAAEPGCPHAGVAAIVTLGSPNLPLPLGQGHDVTGACCSACSVAVALRVVPFLARCSHMPEARVQPQVYITRAAGRVMYKRAK